jgi:hypothetical protein
MTGLSASAQSNSVPFTKTIFMGMIYKLNVNLTQPLRKNQVKEMLNLLTFLNCHWKVALVPQSILELIQGILQMTLLP